jgi:hypothetical protein
MPVRFMSISDGLLHSMGIGVILFGLHAAEGVFWRINLAFGAGRKAHWIVKVGLGYLIRGIDLQLPPPVFHRFFRRFPDM